MERRRRRGLEAILGLGVVAVIVSSVLLVWNSFSGNFSSDIKVTAQLTEAGDALAQGDIVTYRDIIVGEVRSASGSAEGGATLRLTIHAANARVIPTNVTAVALPESLFGPTKIELLAPITPAAAHLGQGAVVAADRTPEAESLQTALANAYTLLTAIHPAELDAALTSLATALQGQGDNLGRLIDQSAAYLRAIAPHLPEFDDTIQSLATVSQALARNAPSLLHSLGNTLVVAKAILANKQAFANLLNVAPGAVDNAQRLLNPTNVDNAITIFTDQQSVLAAFADDPTAIVRTIRGFKSFADTFSKTINNGKVKADVLATGANFAQLFNAAAGDKGTVFDSIKDPPRYTSANCPRYPGLNGPNCTAIGTRAGTTRELQLDTGRNFGGSVSSIGSPQEVSALSGAASAITGVAPADIPDAADLLLGPLLRGSVTVIRAQ